VVVRKEQPARHRLFADTRDRFVQKANVLKTVEPVFTDRRVQRTHTALRAAMLSLMSEHGWDGLNVQDICDRANVGRSTFYTHFDSKEKLLTFSLDGLRSMLLAACLPQESTSSGVMLIARGLLEHLDEQRKLARVILGRRSGQIVHARFREMVTQLVQADTARYAAPGWQRDACVHFISGALMGVLAWRADVRSPPSVDHVVGQLQHMITPAIASLTVITKQRAST
jgi:AcrR family transcriptional regulator